MQLSLFHPLGTMSHRVSEGDLKQYNQNILRVPEREIVISKPTEGEIKTLIQKLSILQTFP
jgi:hypothetical protein